MSKEKEKNERKKSLPSGKSSEKKKNGKSNAAEEVKSEPDKRPVGFAKLVPFLLVCLSLVLAWFLFFPSLSGSLGENTRNVLTGFFSISAFILPAAIIFECVTWRKKMSVFVKTMKIVEAVFIITAVDLGYAMIKNSHGKSFAELFEAGKTLSGGGVVGDFLKNLFVPLVGAAPLWIIIVVIAAVIIFIRAGKTPSDLFGSVFGKREEKELKKAKNSELIPKDRMPDKTVNMRGEDEFSNSEDENIEKQLEELKKREEEKKARKEKKKFRIDIENQNDTDENTDLGREIDDINLRETNSDEKKKMAQKEAEEEKKKSASRAYADIETGEVFEGRIVPEKDVSSDKNVKNENGGKNGTDESGVYRDMKEIFGESEGNGSKIAASADEDGDKEEEYSDGKKSGEKYPREKFYPVSSGNVLKEIKDENETDSVDETETEKAPEGPEKPGKYDIRLKGEEDIKNVDLKGQVTGEELGEIFRNDDGYNVSEKFSVRAGEASSAELSIDVSGNKRNVSAISEAVRAASDINSKGSIKAEKTEIGSKRPAAYENSVSEARIPSWDVPSFINNPNRADAISAAAGKKEEKKEEEILPPEYVFPPINLLQVPKNEEEDGKSEQEETSEKLVSILKSFGVSTRMRNISKGPTVTRYELQPDVGVRVRSIENLSSDIARALAAKGIRIEAPIPGKDTVGIEVPNNKVATVYIREIIDSDEFRNAKSKATCCLGKDVAGKAELCDLAKMPHLLIAGATGTGKSVCLNSFIISILYKARPDEVKFIMIDPKKVELTIYNGIPHLIVPTVTDPKKAAGALRWAVNEMERRFDILEENHARNITFYNKGIADDPTKEKLPLIIIIIDELADLMLTARDDVEISINRLAAKARAAGMHLVIGTQRPSTDVITGLIKANIPSRIAFTVSGVVDSRVILDTAGADKLLGRGDMLYAPVGDMKKIRLQGAYVSDEEVEAVTDFVKNNSSTDYSEEIIASIEKEAAKCGEKKKGASSEDGEEKGEGGVDLGDVDPLLYPAIKYVIDNNGASTSLLQRKMSIGFPRASKLIDTMEAMHVVGGPNGAKPRELLITYDDYLNMIQNKP